MLLRNNAKVSLFEETANKVSLKKDREIPKTKEALPLDESAS